MVHPGPEIETQQALSLEYAAATGPLGHTLDTHVCGQIPSRPALDQIELCRASATTTD